MQIFVFRFSSSFLLSACTARVSYHDICGAVAIFLASRALPLLHIESLSASLARFESPYPAAHVEARHATPHSQRITGQVFSHRRRRTKNLFCAMSLFASTSTAFRAAARPSASVTAKTTARALRFVAPTITRNARHYSDKVISQ